MKRRSDELMTSGLLRRTFNHLRVRFDQKKRRSESDIVILGNKETRTCKLKKEMYI